ncbi:MAG: alpha/beta hydrolase [Bacillota bacterium]|nr:alpha/beta hydrolase [Bacillota bacterium]
MAQNMRHLIFNNLDCDIHYWYREGTEDKWILFFHGAGVDHEMFQAQFEVVDHTYNIIAWDARGHGMSKLKQGKSFDFKEMIKDCLRLYELYNIKKAALIGQSLGGNLAQEIAYYYPELVDKAVLIDCTKNTGQLTFVEKCSLKSARFLFNCYPWKSLIKQSANASSNNDSVRKYIQDCFSRLDKNTFVNIMMESAGNCLHEDNTYRFKQPVLLLCGSNDRLGNIRKVARPWAKSDPNVTLYIIQNASHNSNQDQPTVVNELIVNFLRSKINSN